MLILLWLMVIATIWRLGFHLPNFDIRAFHPQYLNFTLGGYARILALMTGIEIFANLVAAYEGPPREARTHSQSTVYHFDGSFYAALAISSRSSQSASGTS